MASKDDILSSLRALSRDERAEVAHELILSLDEGQEDAGAASEWRKEVQRRADEVISGKASTVDARQAVQELRGKLKSQR
jgi:putative addiction module component (TIGR02574 family)